tara:strand:+ start:1960 stop:2115 length:156 start_codon:yes stop_codon:yes gene_type:complete
MFLGAIGYVALTGKIAEMLDWTNKKLLIKSNRVKETTSHCKFDPVLRKYLR